MFPALARRFHRWCRSPTLGERGERAAAKLLRRNGYTIVARSARDKAGELDIVAIDGRTVVFVEVKTRASDIAGDPADAVDEEKQRRLTRLALRYLKRHDLLEHRWRFDVVAIIWPDKQRPSSIKHFPNAFEPADVGQMFS